MGGVTPRCTELAKQVYQSVFDRVVVVSSTKSAEMTKLLENTQRFVNISLINEITMLCDEMKIDFWEVIEAASTKPYGFTPYYPGPGIGGYCIPVDPIYLLWKAREHNFELQLIEAARRINEQMPAFTLRKIVKSITLSKPMSESSILAIGVTYKRDVNDLRESVAIKIIQILMALGAKVDYYDPYVDEIAVGGNLLKNTLLSKTALESYDCTLILTDHSCIPYELIVRHSPMVFDTRNVTGHLKHYGNVIFL